MIFSQSLQNKKFMSQGYVYSLVDNRRTCSQKNVIYMYTLLAYICQVFFLLIKVKHIKLYDTMNSTLLIHS